MNMGKISSAEVKPQPSARDFLPSAPGFGASDGAIGSSLKDVHVSDVSISSGSVPWHDILSEHQRLPPPPRHEEQVHNHIIQGQRHENSSHGTLGGSACLPGHVLDNLVRETCVHPFYGRGYDTIQSMPLSTAAASNTPTAVLRDRHAAQRHHRALQWQQLLDHHQGSSDGFYSVLGIDCEMVETSSVLPHGLVGHKDALVRLSVVNAADPDHMPVLVDMYVRPTDPVTDYRTDITGKLLALSRPLI